MSKELVIGSNRHETKVAILEEDQLVEVYFQRANEYSLAGSIHKGRVTRVLPGMQSAFVDLGLERDTFLYVSDFFEENEDIDTVSDSRATQPRNGERRDREERRDRSSFRPANDGYASAPVENSTEPSEPGLDKLSSDVVSTEGEVPPPVQPVTDASPLLSTAGERIPPFASNRDGDRRNRRSRRRRQRGRGFPENKYAQPSPTPDTNGESHSAPPIIGEESEPDSASVIVLPGESLAKYRRQAGGPESSLPPSDEEIDDDVADLDSASDVDEDLEAQAEEIELSDRIFSHRDTDEEISDVAEEDKLAEVRSDEPSSPFVVPDLDTEEEDDGATATGGMEAHPRMASALDGSDDEGSSLGADEELRGANSDAAFGNDLLGEDDTVILIEEHELIISALPEDSSGSYDGADFDDGATGIGDDSLPGNEQAEVEPLTSGSDLGAGNPSTELRSATVREPNERYPHRAPRRMRRRRGGSRFGGGGPNASPAAHTSSGGATGLAGPGSGTATVPVFGAEQRREPVIAQAVGVEKSERMMPSISELLKPGQEIIVQIAKEPLGQKGARITSHIALPGRYVVFMPSVEHLGVSRKIASDEERQRLKRILQAHRTGTSGGFIVRTAGEGISEEDIAADMNFLYTLWLDIRQKAEKKPAPALLHYDLDVVQRILRDQVTEEFKAIWVDNEDLYENVLSFMQRFQPSLVNRVKMYTRSAPIFDAFNITQELEKALRPKVWLKSGGYIVINQTEALVAIDINTGKFVGKSNRLEDTIVKTNTEAVKEIVRQIRLRDLGGIIVVDFIDMDERKNRQKVMQALEDAMRADRAPYKILQFNDFGLVAITRKRVKQSLERALCAPCTYCEGAGYIKSVPTVISEVLIEAQKIARAIEGNDVVLRVNPDVAKVLKSSENKYLEELEDILGRPVLVKGDATLHQEKFDLG